MLADYYFYQGFGVYILLAWYTSGISHFFSVTFDPASALLGACLLPALLVSMFGGTNTLWTDMSGFQQAVAKIGPGWYTLENLTVIQIKALPAYLSHSPPVVDMLQSYNYKLDSLTKNSIIMLVLGFVWRILTLMSLQVNVHGAFRNIFF